MDRTQNSNNSLSIRFTSDGFSLYIKDSANKTILTNDYRIINQDNKIEEFETFLDQVLDLKIDLSNTQFHIESNHYTVSPMGLFNLNELLSIIDFQNSSLPEDGYTLQVNEFKEYNILIAFIINTAIYKAITNKFDNNIINHHLTDLIHEILLEKSSVYANVRSNQVDILWAQNNQLIYCNSHYYSSNEDILYHILNMKESLPFDFENTTVVINTETSNQGLENLLDTHISKLEFKTYTR